MPGIGNVWGVVVVALAGLLAYGATARVRLWALRRQVVDVPNARSSHQVPTPRGGGIAIIIAWLLTLVPVAWFAGLPDLPPVVLLAVILVATVGFIDDLRDLAPLPRLLLHAVAAVLVALAWHGLPVLHGFGTDWFLGWLMWPLVILFLLWCLNLFNFMDGIDGIAGVQTLSVALGLHVCYRLALPAEAAPVSLLLLAAATLGFLAWNWPPAKIFMGDAGSGFIGFLLAAEIVGAARAQPGGGLFWAGVLLMGVFVVDATWTLLRRLRRGERVMQAHRSHAYQRASRLAGAHRPVTLAVLALNVFWLLPWAVAVATGRVDGAWAIVMAWLPLCGLAWYFKAGLPDAGAEGARDGMTQEE